MAMFLDVKNPVIPGEAKGDPKHPDWQNKIEIESFQWSVTQQTSQGRGKGLVSSGARAGHLSITKVMDKSTPVLWYHLAAGIPILQMFVRVSRAGGAQGSHEAETNEFDNVIVSSYNTGGGAGAGGLPVEHWTFSATRAHLKTQTVDPAGNLLPGRSAGYDFSKGTPT